MLPLHDTVRIWLHEDTGEKDAHGRPIREWVDKGDVPASVEPLPSEDIYRTESALSRYRVVLAPRVPLPATVGDNLRVMWREFSGDPANFDSTGGLQVDGTVETRTLRGRVHHYALTTKAVT